MPAFALAPRVRQDNSKDISTRKASATSSPRSIPTRDRVMVHHSCDTAPLLLHTLPAVLPPFAPIFCSQQQLNFVFHCDTASRKSPTEKYSDVADGDCDKPLSAHAWSSYVSQLADCAVAVAVDSNARKSHRRLGRKDGKIQGNKVRVVALAKHGSASSDWTIPSLSQPGERLRQSNKVHGAPGARAAVVKAAATTTAVETTTRTTNPRPPTATKLMTKCSRTNVSSKPTPTPTQTTLQTYVDSATTAAIAPPPTLTQRQVETEISPTNQANSWLSTLRSARKDVVAILRALGPKAGATIATASVPWQLSLSAAQRYELLGLKHQDTASVTEFSARVNVDGTAKKINQKRHISSSLCDSTQGHAELFDLRQYARCCTLNSLVRLSRMGHFGLVFVPTLPTEYERIVTGL